MCMVQLLEKEFLLARSKSLLCLFLNQKFPFYTETGEQSLLMFSVISINGNQKEMIVKKLVRSVHV